MNTKTHLPAACLTCCHTYTCIFLLQKFTSPDSFEREVVCFLGEKVRNFALKVTCPPSVLGWDGTRSTFSSLSQVCGAAEGTVLVSLTALDSHGGGSGDAEG